VNNNQSNKRRAEVNMNVESESRTSEGTRKRRLNRKEQKARKKQQKHPPQDEKKASNSALDSVKAQPHDKASSPPLLSPEEIQASYIPTPIPTLADLRQTHKKSLGKWFPDAVVLKSAVQYTNADLLKLEGTGSRPTASLLLFYQYFVPQWPMSRVDLLMAYLIRMAETSRTNLGGRIRVAKEGVNVTLSAVDDMHSTAAATLRHFALDLKRFDPEAFSKTGFKYVDFAKADRHFKDLKLFPVQEIVYYGFPKSSNDDDPAPLDQTGVHLPPREFHKMLALDGTVVIDVRNHYEAALGRFDGQQQQQQQATAGCSDDKPVETTSTDEDHKTQTTTSTKQNTPKKVTTGAEYIDPKMRKSTDFAKWLGKEETKEKLRDKNVLLFCTGGVRCERASAYLKKNLGSEHVKGVYQLDGGVENYLKDFPSGGFWRGKNFVFDKREACGAGDNDGDGGVVGAGKRSTAGLETKCCLCSKAWDRYVGKKKCSTCGVPVLMCDTCMSNKKLQKEKLSRCPLCVEENVTVRAEDVEWTNNGVDIVSSSSPGTKKPGDATGSKANNSKVASSVLKWGGGHAANKKDRRRFKSSPCRFGTDCMRKDCFFAHPTRQVTTAKDKQT
jgi:predicted sulfurtransferase